MGDILIKELKYKKFRVYFIQSKNTLKILSEKEFQTAIIKFIALSLKGKEQQKFIDRIKSDLLKKGFDFF